MKTKVLVVLFTMLFTMLFALAMMAQTATQAPAAPATGDQASTCPCCGHDMANMKPGDKCPMMKDGKMAGGKSCCSKDGGCCKDGKCDMAAHKNGKGCCGDKCPMMKKGGTPSAAMSCCGKDGGCCKTVASTSCCHRAAACCKNGNLPCCDANRSAA